MGNNFGSQVGDAARGIGLGIATSKMDSKTFGKVQLAGLAVFVIFLIVILVLVLRAPGGEAGEDKEDKNIKDL